MILSRLAAGRVLRLQVSTAVLIELVARANLPIFSAHVAI